MSTWSAIIQLVRKDLKTLIRAPFYLFVSLVLPLFFFLLFNIITAGSATQPVAVARDSHGPWSDKFVQMLRESPTGRRAGEQPYWEVITTDPVQARQLYASDQVMGLITIPANFDQDVSQGRQVQVSIAANNINSDYTKNLWFRVDHNLEDFNRTLKGSVIAIHEDALFERDVRMILYMAASLVVFAFFYGGMINTVTAITREWDDGTVQELLLSPYGRWGVMGGKLLVGLCQTILSGVLVWIATWIFAGFVPQGPWWGILALLGTTTLMGIGIGALVGIWQRRVLPAIQFCLVLSILVFLLGSGLSPLSGVAWSGVTEAAYNFSLFLPPTYAFQSSHLLLNGGSLTGLPTTLLILGLTGLIALGFAAWLLYRGGSSERR